MPCKPECQLTTSLTKDGKRKMIAQPGNKKFEPGQVHPQCDDCFKEMLAQAEKEIKKQRLEDPAQLKLDALKMKIWASKHGGK